jgi:hypothetical protein
MYRVFPMISPCRPMAATALRAVAGALVLGLAAACAGPGADTETQRTLAVLGLEDGASAAMTTGAWTVAGADAVDDGLVTPVNKDGVPALRIANGEDAFALLRPTRTPLLVTPYLSWAWNIDAQGPGRHPVRLMVGFSGGRPPPPAPKGRRRPAPEWRGVPLPPHDRALAVTWGDSALQRGSLTLGHGGPGDIPIYTTRGGRENAGSWWLETVDLSELYARAWPGDDLSLTHVTFIGVAAAVSPPKAAAHVSGIVLSR